MLIFSGRLFLKMMFCLHVSYETYLQITLCNIFAYLKYCYILLIVLTSLKYILSISIALVTKWPLMSDNQYYQKIVY